MQWWTVTQQQQVSTVKRGSTHQYLHIKTLQHVQYSVWIYHSFNCVVSTALELMPECNTRGTDRLMISGQWEHFILSSAISSGRLSLFDSTGHVDPFLTSSNIRIKLTVTCKSIFNNHCNVFQIKTRQEWNPKSECSTCDDDDDDDDKSPAFHCLW